MVIRQNLGVSGNVQSVKTQGGKNSTSSAVRTADDVQKAQGNCRIVTKGQTLLHLQQQHPVCYSWSVGRSIRQSVSPSVHRSVLRSFGNYIFALTFLVYTVFNGHAIHKSYNM